MKEAKMVATILPVNFILTFSIKKCSYWQLSKSITTPVCINKLVSLLIAVNNSSGKIQNHGENDLVIDAIPFLA
jgi:hypothetical protein